VRYDTLIPGRDRKRPESVLVTIYTADRQTLLLRRVGNPIWQSVTGSLLWEEEHPSQAARREVEEETGIVAPSGWRDWQESRTFMIMPESRYRYGPGVTVNLEHVFSLEVSTAIDVRLNPREHTEHQWVVIDQALEMVWSRTNFLALSHLKQELV
jgi:dATP pyrophosphohydrolase